MIELRDLSKRYGAKLAVDHITATIRAGVVTGFLGPNGAGKSTTMRMIVGLDRPTTGEAIVNGKVFRQHRAPLREVGALLEAKAVHGGRTARNHLMALAATHGIPRHRVEEVIDMTGLARVAKKRAGTFSLGMGQRLGIAAALLGDPQTLILDEPVNGLDPEGVRWIRQLTRHLADEGRTVFLSSHLMSEMAQTADHVIVLGRGRILADAPIEEILSGTAHNKVRVRTPQAASLAEVLLGLGAAVTRSDEGVLEVGGMTADLIGEAAAREGIVLHELTPIARNLEEAFLELTHDDVEYRSEAAR